MAKDISRMIDPVILARDCGYELDPWQANLLREMPRRALLCCSRQSGKSLVTALIALWSALYEAPALIVIASPSMRQSAEMLRTLTGLYGKLSGAPEMIGESVLKLELANGSRVLSVPGSEKTIRGLSKVSLVIVDECARVPDELLSALRPMLAVTERGGRLIMLSTPFGKRGEFYRAWAEGGVEWTRVSVPASECPRISTQFLEEERRQLGNQRYSEEYELAFLEPDEAVFGTDIIEAAFTPDVLPLWR
jgi:hypothetical protein